MVKRRAAKRTTRSELNAMIRQRQLVERAETSAESEDSEETEESEATEESEKSEESEGQKALVQKMEEMTIVDLETDDESERMFEKEVKDAMNNVGDILSQGIEKLNEEEPELEKIVMEEGESQEIKAKALLFTEECRTFMEMVIERYGAVNGNNAEMAEEAIDELQNYKNTLITQISEVIEKKVIEKIPDPSSESQLATGVLARAIAVKAANEVEATGVKMAKMIYRVFPDAVEITQTRVSEYPEEKMPGCSTSSSEVNAPLENKYNLPESWSPELRAKVTAMYDSLPKAHELVYPEDPVKKNALITPTGRLMRCMCSPNCQFEIGEPEYRNVNRKEVDILIGPQKKTLKNARKVKKNN